MSLFGWLHRPCTYPIFIQQNSDFKSSPKVGCLSNQINTQSNFVSTDHQKQCLELPGDIKKSKSKSNDNIAPVKDKAYQTLDVYHQTPIKLTVKVEIPVKQNPEYNFIGRLLGPKGNTLKRVQEESGTKMAVLGRGSMKDRRKEEELRRSNNPDSQHLKEDLHVKITTHARPADAYDNISKALRSLEELLKPVTNDKIKQLQMQELEFLDDISNQTLCDNISHIPLILPKDYLTHSVTSLTPPPEQSVSHFPEEGRYKLLSRKEHVMLRREKSDPY